jgi:hypothetical protein
MALRRPVDWGEPEFQCEKNLGLVGVAFLADVPVFGAAVRIQADQVRLLFTSETCEEIYFRLTAESGTIDGSFQWNLVRPAGSNTVLEDDDTLHPSLTIDSLGEYRIELLPCSESCTVSGITLPPQPAQVITFIPPAVLPPESVPSVSGSAQSPVPPTTFSESELQGKCDPNFLAADAQLVTVENFEGPESYARFNPATGEVEAFEGEVAKGKVAGADNVLNHNSHDATFDVVPDPAHRSLLMRCPDCECDGEPCPSDGPTRNILHVEWETYELPGPFRPSPGDRVSVWGFWTHDCGHQPFNTEIHPPVGVASHRRRAIPIPSDVFFTFPGMDDTVGGNVYVPGILTEVWFSRRGGEMMAGGDSELHQPCCDRRGVCYQCPDGSVRRDPACSSSVIGEAFGCFPADYFLPPGVPPEAVRKWPIDDPAPLEAVFSFRIYPPRSPKAALEAAGFTGLPEVPLYSTVVQSSSEMQGRIQIEPCPPPDICRRVRVDFTDPPPLGSPLWFRIATAWVYPSADNWGLRRRRLFADKIDVLDNGEDMEFTGGDWRLWLNVNNAAAPGPGTDAALPSGEVLLPTTHEWTKILHKDNVQEGEIALGFETGRSDLQGLGPDLLLFSKDLLVDQMVLLQATGYNEEGFMTDKTLGLFSLKFILESDGYYGSNHGSTGGNYRLFWRLQDRGPVTPTSLSTGARQLASAYDLSKLCRPGSPCLNELRPPERPLTWHPDEAPLPARLPSLPRAETPLYAAEAFEEYHLENLEPHELYQSIVEAQATDPDRVARLLEEIREAIDEDLDALGPEVLVDVSVLRAALPWGLWRRYFGDLPPPESPPDASRRSMGGAAIVGGAGDWTIVGMKLQCDPARLPNRLTVSWRENDRRKRFAMDLMTAFACDRPPEPMRVHRGEGIGRLDQQRGARALWTFVDAGKGGRDLIRLSVWDPQGRTVLDLDAAVAIGNLRGDEGEQTANEAGTSR